MFERCGSPAEDGNGRDAGVEREQEATAANSAAERAMRRMAERYPRQRHARNGEGPKQSTVWALLLDMGSESYGFFAGGRSASVSPASVKRSRWEFPFSRNSIAL